MIRGEIWTVSGGGDYAQKPRPVVILQDDAFGDTGSVTICVFSRDPTEAPLFRIPISPDERNGLHEPSCVMVDKITTVARSRIGRRVGVLSSADMGQIERAVFVFLGLARASASAGLIATTGPDEPALPNAGVTGLRSVSGSGSEVMFRQSETTRFSIINTGTEYVVTQRSRNHLGVLLPIEWRHRTEAAARSCLEAAQAMDEVFSTRGPDQFDAALARMDAALTAHSRQCDDNHDVPIVGRSMWEQRPEDV